jgi:hypothetical protein
MPLIIASAGYWLEHRNCGAGARTSSSDRHGPRIAEANVTDSGASPRPAGSTKTRI